MGVVGLYPGDAGGGTCACDDAPPLMLEESLTVPSVGCIVCYQAVSLDLYELDRDLALELAAWELRIEFGLKARLKSGSLSGRHLRERQNLASEANVEVLKIVQRLNRWRRAYYAVPQDVTREGFRPLRTCPRCRKQLTPRYGLKCCDACMIVITDECTPDYPFA